MTNSWEDWSEGKIARFRKIFLDWYQQEHRLLPWRENQDPYRIWISEIMLQQTRVDTVIGYFYRFMETFPTIEALAEAPEDKLLKVWEGLGYYSRARNLKAAAQQIMTEFDGKMPQTLAEIQSLKGIGPYTAGAIASIAFNFPEPAIDGNVMRVVSRLFEIDADIAKPASRKIFDEAMRTIIDPQQPGEFNQALMDLGSAICTPTSPQCSACPLQAFCQSAHHGTQTQYPVKSKKAKPKPVYYLALVIEKDGKLLLEQRPATGLLANFWTFPLVEVTESEYRHYQQTWQPSEGPLDLVAEDELVIGDWPVVWQKRTIGEATHVFSHLKWHLLIFHGHALNVTLAENQRWISLAGICDYPLPKPQLKMLDVIKQEHLFD